MDTDLKRKVLLIPSLMLLVAGAQHFSHHWFQLTPWKGGGFGMFSSVDSISGRFLKVSLYESGKAQPLEISLPSSFPKNLRRKMITAPMDLDYELASRGLLAMRWAHRSRGRVEALRVTQKLKQTDRLILPEKVVIELWVQRFDNKSHQVTPEKLKRWEALPNES